MHGRHNAHDAIAVAQRVARRRARCPRSRARGRPSARPIHSPSVGTVDARGRRSRAAASAPPAMVSCAPAEEPAPCRPPARRPTSRGRDGSWNAGRSSSSRPTQGLPSLTRRVHAEVAGRRLAVELGADEVALLDAQDVERLEPVRARDPRRRSASHSATARSPAGSAARRRARPRSSRAAPSGRCPA